jgi:hypothetical protein
VGVQRAGAGKAAVGPQQTGVEQKCGRSGVSCRCMPTKKWVPTPAHEGKARTRRGGRARDRQAGERPQQEGLRRAACLIGTDTGGTGRPSRAAPPLCGAAQTRRHAAQIRGGWRRRICLGQQARRGVQEPQGQAGGPPTANNGVGSGAFWGGGRRRSGGSAAGAQFEGGGRGRRARGGGACVRAPACPGLGGPPWVRRVPLGRGDGAAGRWRRGEAGWQGCQAGPGSFLPAAAGPRRSPRATPPACMHGE